MSGWIYTKSGKRVQPLDLKPHDIDLRDIAHALAYKIRWGGHCSRPYSVAEHSIRVATIARRLSLRPHPLTELHALLHDAHEAYLADVPRPVKAHLPGWHEIEAQADLAIFSHFGLTDPVPPVIKLADDVVLHQEAAALFESFPLEALPKIEDPAALDIAREEMACSSYEPWEWGLYYQDRVLEALDEAGLS